MEQRSSRARMTASHWLLLPLAGFVFTVVFDSSTTATAQAQSVSVASAASAPELAPGIPNKPDLVTIIPFYEKPDRTDLEKTRIIVPADVDGVHGMFMFDLGAVPMVINRTFLQPNAKGGVDSVTAANKLPDYTPRRDYMDTTAGFDSLVFGTYDKAHVRLTLGTLVDDFDDPNLSKKLRATPNAYNVLLGHSWGNFAWDSSPRLGNIGPVAVEPFETIVDYTRKRIVLIRLDSAGNRMVEVPAYTPRYTAVIEPIEVMAGMPLVGLNVNQSDVIDTVTPANNINTKYLDTGAEVDMGNFLGYPFLHNLGMFGLNQRKHEFYLYR